MERVRTQKRFGKRKKKEKIFTSKASTTTIKKSVYVFDICICVESEENQTLQIIFAERHPSLLHSAPEKVM